MLYDQLNIKWEDNNRQLDKGGKFFKYGKTGVSQKTGHRIKIFDREYVYRGHPNATCPSDNWVTFPKGNEEESESKLSVMKKLETNCPLVIYRRDQAGVKEATKE
jgi:hypothetical protein